MRIALNAHLLSFGPSYRGAGISRYIRQLIANLRLQSGEDHFTVYFGDPRLPPELTANARLEPRVSRLPTVNPLVRMIWEQAVQPVALWQERIDLLHSLGYVQPLACRARSVLTIHDLSFLRYPEAFNRPNRVYLRFLTLLSARRADRIIAVSESTKQDASQMLGVSPAKIAVVYHGVEGQFRQVRNTALLDAFRARADVPERFILYCGTMEPRKNVDVLISAYSRLRQRGIVSHKLVLAGAKGWRYDHIFAAVERLGLRDEVVFPGYLASDVQPLWYNAADVFVYPSLYEGFGFPPLEAMACGTPVVASNRSSLPEVVGAAGLLVEPNDEALSDAMGRVLGDEDMRQHLAEAGLARAARFSWARATTETLEVYRASL